MNKIYARAIGIYFGLFKWLINGRSTLLIYVLFLVRHQTLRSRSTPGQATGPYCHTSQSPIANMFI